MKVVEGWNTINAIMSSKKNYERTPFLSVSVTSQ
jgi:hypothetical protein